MLMRRKWLDVDHLPHGYITSVIGMEVIPRQLCKCAVRQKLCQHVASRGIERNGIEIFNAVIEPRAADESVEDPTAGVMPWTVVAHINPADAQRRGQCPGVDFDASGVQAADDVLISGDDRICRRAGSDVV